MIKNKMDSAAFLGFLNKLHTFNASLGAFLSYADALAARSRYDGICGSWMSEDGSRSLLVRPYDTGYSLLVLDNTKCYKTIEWELYANMRGRKLWIEVDNRKEEVIYDGLRQTLSIGCLGIFRTEESLIYTTELDSSKELLEDEY